MKPFAAHLLHALQRHLESDACRYTDNSPAYYAAPSPEAAREDVIGCAPPASQVCRGILPRQQVGRPQTNHGQSPDCMMCCATRIPGTSLFLRPSTPCWDIAWSNSPITVPTIFPKGASWRGDMLVGRRFQRCAQPLKLMNLIRDAVCDCTPFLTAASA